MRPRCSANAADRPPERGSLSAGRQSSIGAVNKPCHGPVSYGARRSEPGKFGLSSIGSQLAERAEVSHCCDPPPRAARDPPGLAIDAGRLGAAVGDSAHRPRRHPTSCLRRPAPSRKSPDQGGRRAETRSRRRDVKTFETSPSPVIAPHLDDPVGGEAVLPLGCGGRVLAATRWRRCEAARPRWGRGRTRSPC